MNDPISIGKYRALQRATTEKGIFTILAIDHMDALRRAINPDDPNSVSDMQMIAFKQDVVQSMQDHISGVLLDPVYSAGQMISKSLPKSVGLLVELEKADYEMQPLPNVVDIRPNWSVEKIKRMSADGVKLFYYYDPENTELCEKQDKTIQAVVADCQTYDIPLYAEPIILNASPENRASKVYQSAQRASELGADILKLEFPVDVSVEIDVAVWEEACHLLSSIGKPWVLLSAGVDFETFCQQVDVACKAGASGFIAGRAVWGDACKILDSHKRIEWLESVGVERMKRLIAIANQYATPSWKNHSPQITPNWHKNY